MTDKNFKEKAKYIKNVFKCIKGVKKKVKCINNVFYTKLFSYWKNKSSLFRFQETTL